MNLFGDTLRDVVARVEGVRSAMIVGIDGIIIERAFSTGEDISELNIEMVTAEFTSLLKTALRTADDVEVGTMLEMTVFTEKCVFVIRMITEEYYIMVVMDPDGNFGRARYELKKAKYLLEKEFLI